MQLEGWFWVVVNATLIAAFIRQYRLAMKELTIPDGWPRATSERSRPTEGDRADEKQSG